MFNIHKKKEKKSYERVFPERDISQRAYPSNETLKEIPSYIANLEDNDLRQVLTVILNCGFRIGEIIHSYWYFTDNKEIEIRAPMEKKNISGFKLSDYSHRGFVGDRVLRNRLRDENMWKSVKTIPELFNLPRSFMLDNISTDKYDPVFPFKRLTYPLLYKRFKKEDPLKCLYFSGKYEEPRVIETFIPKFHFYRKALISKLIRYFQKESDVVRYLKWDSYEMLLVYSKLFVENDPLAAARAFADGGGKFGDE